MKKYFWVIFFLPFISQHITAQEKKDSTNNKKSYHKWRICASVAPTLGFNLGTKIPLDYDQNQNGYWGWLDYNDVKEVPQIGFQVSLEAISNTSLNGKFAIRMGFDFDDINYRGTATGISTTLTSTWPTTSYSTTVMPNYFQYLSKEYYLNIHFIPQYNFHQTDKAVYYYFLGPSFGSLIAENEDEEDYDGYTYLDDAEFLLFGNTGIGSTIKTSKSFYLDIQAQFVCQLYSIILPLPNDPDGRRLASAGLRIGLIF